MSKLSIFVVLVALGSLTFFINLSQAQDNPGGGRPPAGATQAVEDLDAQIAYQRAFEAVVWAMPASAIYRLREGLFQLPGVKDNVIVANSRPLQSKHKAITSNAVTPYISAHTDLRNGPTVLEVPAKTDKASLYGQVVDAWQSTIADVGPSGIDKGQGGKYLFIPPGYDKEIPSGYIPFSQLGFE